MEKIASRERKSMGMRARGKRFVATVLVVVMTLAISVTALADGGKSSGSAGGAPGGQSQQDGQRGQSPQGGTQSESQSDATEARGPGSGANGQAAGFNTDQVEEAIAALTDETVQANLTALLETYVAAEEAKQTALAANETDLTDLTSAVTAAKEALETALTAAGVETDDLFGAQTQANDGTGRMQNKPALNTTAISEAIAALADTDENKASLTALMTAYETALAAQNAADTSSLTEDEIAALAESTKTAEQALQEALKNAGIAEEPILEQNRQQNQTNTAQSSGTADSFDLNVVQGDSTDADSTSTGIISAILNWLSTLIN